MANRTRPGRTYWILCGDPGCTAEADPDFDRPGWPVAEADLVDGELWLCPACRGAATTRRPIEWVAWIVDGHVQHFRADSPTGRAIVARLAEPRRCVRPGCDEPLTGRASQRYHSDGCRQAAAADIRARDAKRPRNGGSGPAIPETSVTRSNDGPSPQVDDHALGPVIADTADMPTSPPRRCAECGKDISHRRVDAKFCKGSACRKALARRAEAIAATAELSDVLGQLTLDVETGGRL